MYKIFIDPGHGGTDPGAVANGLKEKEINLTVAKEVKRLLEINKIQVKLSRESDMVVSLTQRAKDANSFEADYFVSIHHNAGGGDGYEIIHSASGGKGKELAEKIGVEFEKIGQNKRKIYYRTDSRGKDYFAVIRQANMPAIITEFAFMDSKDVEIINTTEKLNLQAKAIANGVLKQLGIVPTTDKFIESINKLAEKGIISSSNYWISNSNYNPDYVKILVQNSAKYIMNDFIKSINVLVEEGIISSPNYWIDNKQYSDEYIKLLIEKIATSIK